MEGDDNTRNEIPSSLGEGVEDNYFFVAKKPDGSSFLDRTDALSVQNKTRFNNASLANLIGLKDQEYRKALDLPDSDPNKAKAADAFQQVMQEIKLRREAARTSGMLRMVDDKLSGYEQQLRDMQVALSTGGLTPSEIISFQTLLSGITLPDRRQESDPRFDGIDEVDFRMRMQGLQGAARKLINEARSAQTNNPHDIGDAVGSAVRTVLERGRLSSEEGYAQLQDAERYCASPYTLQPETQTFYTEMPYEEKAEIKLRLELMQLVVMKKQIGVNLEGYGKDQRMKEALTAFTKAELSNLYSIEGVRSALELYAELINDRQHYTVRRDDGSRYTLFECKDRNDLEGFRSRISGCRNVRSAAGRDVALVDTHLFLNKQNYKKNIYEDLYDRYRTEGLDHSAARKKAVRKAVDAEQIAFNLLVLGNTFEAKDARWIDQQGGYKVRVERPTLGEPDMITPSLRGEMLPADSGIDKYIKQPHEIKKGGTFDPYIYANIDKARRQHGIDKFDYIQVFPYRGDTESQDMLWQVGTTGDGKTYIRVPDCYPPVLIGSFYDETKISDVSLWEYLSQRRDIPWNSPGTQAPWRTYHDKCGAASVVIKYVMGKDKTPDIDLVKKLGSSREGAIGDLEPWAAEISKALIDLGLNDDDQFKRWLFYAAVGLQPNSRDPKAAVSPAVRDLLSVLDSGGQFHLRYLPKGTLFFPSDKVSRLSTIGSLIPSSGGKK